MVAFRVFLGTLLAVITIYTLAVVAEHGLNLFAVFFGDIGALGWPGQFNLDFLGMLMLSALWTAWRMNSAPRAWCSACWRCCSARHFSPSTCWC